jgi:hypothetical protein
MQLRYVLTPQQLSVLRALARGIVELSTAEIAVYARLLPRQVEVALGSLERLGLVHSWPITGERLSVLTDDGQMVLRGIEQVSGAPPVGAVFRLPLPSATIGGLAWPFAQPRSSQLEIVADKHDE